MSMPQRLPLSCPPRIIEQKDFAAGEKSADTDRTMHCLRICRDMCRFGAISGEFIVDPLRVKDAAPASSTAPQRP